VLKALVMKCSMDYVLTWVDVESFIELKSWANIFKVIALVLLQMVNSLRTEFFKENKMNFPQK
jgi:hypothetical protein